MEQLRISRDLKLKDIEIFRIIEGHFGLPISYMLLIDFKRPSTLEDFEYLADVEDKASFGRANYIKVVYISNKEFQQNIIEELLSIAAGFLDNKDDCHWNASFKVIDDNLFEDISYSGESEFNFIQTILEELKLDINLLNISEDKFDLLSQD